MSIALSPWAVRGPVGVLHVPAEVVKSLWVTVIPNNAGNANAVLRFLAWSLEFG